MTKADDGSLKRVWLVLADGRRCEFAAAEVAACCAATLNLGGESCRVVFEFRDGTAAEIRHDVTGGGVTARITPAEWA